MVYEPFFLQEICSEGGLGAPATDAISVDYRQVQSTLANCPVIAVSIGLMELDLVDLFTVPHGLAVWEGTGVVA